MRLFFCFVIWATLSASALAEGLVQVVVSSASSGADGSGALFSGTLQRGINASGRYATVAEKDGAAFTLEISTMGLDEVNKKVLGGGMLSLYKVVLLLRLEGGAYMYLDSWAGYCGQDRAQEMAEKTAAAALADLDAAVAALAGPAKEQAPPKDRK